MVLKDHDVARARLARTGELVPHPGLLRGQDRADLVGGLDQHRIEHDADETAAREGVVIGPE